jgi:hypothetical protein
LQQAGFFSALKTAKLGWVDEMEVRASWKLLDEAYREDRDEYLRYYWDLWMVVAIEMWIRALDPG